MLTENDSNADDDATAELSVISDGDELDDEKAEKDNAQVIH